MVSVTKIILKKNVISKKWFEYDEKYGFTWYANLYFAFFFRWISVMNRYPSIERNNMNLLTLSYSFFCVSKFHRYAMWIQTSHIWTFGYWSIIFCTYNRWCIISIPAFLVQHLGKNGKIYGFCFSVTTTVILKLT